jgi:hypothetical protein
LVSASESTTVVTGLGPRFTDREPYEHGFARIFNKQIAPGLAQMEVERRRLKRLRTVKLAVGLGISAAILAAAFTQFDWGKQGFVFGLAFVAAVMVPIFIVGSPTDKFRDKLRELVIPPVTRFLDITYARAVPEAFGLARFIDRKVVGDYTASRSKVQDYVTGTHKGRGYAMAEANLQRRSGKSTVTVFKGLLLSIDWPEAGQASVLIGRDYGKLFNKIAGLGKATRVTFEDQDFEKRFEVYATDETVARQLLTPAVLQSLVAVAEGRKGQTPTAAFTDGRFLLALPIAEDLFEPGSLSRSMDRFEEDMHTLLRHLTIPQRVIEILQGARQPIT